MNDVASLIEAGVARLFAAEVTRPVLLAFEAGEWQQALWDQVAATGFQRTASESSSGSELLPVLRAVGAYAVPLPLGETLLANWLLRHAGWPEDEGPLSLVQADESVQLVRDGPHLVVQGLARRVPWGRHVRRLLISGDVEGRATIALVEPGTRVRIEHGVNLAAEPRDHLAFDRCRCIDAVEMQGAAQAVRMLGAVARACALAGAIEATLELSVRYAGERSQFGRPIGSFQAIQQQLAQLACETIAANAAAAAACDALASDSGWTEAATAKARAGKAAEIAAAVGHQVHGAMGFTHEYFLQFLSRRLWSWRTEFGNGASWARLLGAEAIRAGGRRFWTDLTTPSRPGTDRALSTPPLP